MLLSQDKEQSVYDRMHPLMPRRDTRLKSKEGNLLIPQMPKIKAFEPDESYRQEPLLLLLSAFEEEFTANRRAFGLSYLKDVQARFQIAWEYRDTYKELITHWKQQMKQAEARLSEIEENLNILQAEPALPEVYDGTYIPDLIATLQNARKEAITRVKAYRCDINNAQAAIFLIDETQGMVLDWVSELEALQETGKPKPISSSADQETKGKIPEPDPDMVHTSAEKAPNGKADKPKRVQRESTKRRYTQIRQFVEQRVTGKSKLPIIEAMKRAEKKFQCSSSTVERALKLKKG